MPVYLNSLFPLKVHSRKDGVFGYLAQDFAFVKTAIARISIGSVCTGPVVVLEAHIIIYPETITPDT